MKIHEYQAKKIFSEYEIPVPNGFHTEQGDSVSELCAKNNLTESVVKAQVLAGGRGKAGGIKKAKSPKEAQDIAMDMIGKTLTTYQGGGKGEVIRSVWIEECKPFSNELYMGLVIDRFASSPTLIFSESGGMDIEEVAAKTPEKVVKIPFRIDRPFDADFFKPKFKLTEVLEPFRGQLADIAAKLAKLFVEKDCSLLEINPLAVGGNGKLIALDAKAVFDDTAMFRHSELSPLKDPYEDDPKETRAHKFGLNYVSLEGNVGCLVNGAGLAMATMDAIKAAGGEPSNFLDVGGGATKEAVQEGFSIMLEDDSVKAILVNIFGGIMKCDIIAQALVDASKALKLTVPIVVRIEGTNVEQGRAILAQSGLKIHTASSISEAAKKAVAFTKGS